MFCRCRDKGVAFLNKENEDGITVVTAVDVRNGPSRTSSINAMIVLFFAGHSDLVAWNRMTLRI